MRDNLLTLERGRELLAKQKGIGFSIVDGEHTLILGPVGAILVSAPTLRMALLRAGVVIPDPLWPFIATGLSVIRNGKHIAKAESATMASRIANALNAHKPDKRGR